MFYFYFLSTVKSSISVNFEFLNESCVDVYLVFYWGIYLFKKIDLWYHFCVRDKVPCWSFFLVGQLLSSYLLKNLLPALSMYCFRGLTFFPHS